MTFGSNAQTLKPKVPVCQIMPPPIVWFVIQASASIKLPEYSNVGRRASENTLGIHISLVLA